MDIKELENKSKAVYRIFFGCLPICLTEAAEASELQDKLHKLFISEGLVKAVHKESDSVQITKETVAEGISLRPPLRKGREIISLDTPIRINLDYSSEKLDPDYYDKYKKKRKIRASLFYDGFVYVLAFEQDKDKRFNFSRHAAYVQKWMANLMTREKGITVVDVSPSPMHGSIMMYLLRETIALSGEEEGYLDWPSYIAGTGNSLKFAYDASEESVQEAIENTMDMLLLVDLDVILREFYLCQILYNEIVTENKNAKQIIGRVTNESLSFYDISFLNFPQRLKKSKEIGKDLALLYALMPQIEQLSNEHESHKSLVKTDGSDKSASAVCGMLNSNLTLGTENIFTQRIREMLQQDVSEIRAQVNYQLLFISALLTFLSIVITAIVSSVS